MICLRVQLCPLQTAKLQHQELAFGPESTQTSIPSLLSHLPLPNPYTTPFHTASQVGPFIPSSPCFFTLSCPTSGAVVSAAARISFPMQTRNAQCATIADAGRAKRVHSHLFRADILTQRLGISRDTAATRRTLCEAIRRPHTSRTTLIAATCRMCLWSPQAALLSLGHNPFQPQRYLNTYNLIQRCPAEDMRLSDTVPLDHRSEHTLASLPGVGGIVATRISTIRHTLPSTARPATTRDANLAPP